MKTLIFTLIGLLAVAVANKVSYENYKVYNIVPETDEQVQVLIDLHKQGSYDFWTEVFKVGTPVRMMVSPAEDSEFLRYSESFQLKPEVTISNVQRLIEEQMKPSHVTSRNIAGNFSWTAYHTLDEIHAWIDELGLLFPNVVTVINIGSSNEGRPLKGVKIDLKPNERGDNPLIGMIEGGIHAREWISPATVTWIINEFLTSTDPEIKTLAEIFVWHIIPVANPDGYAYTFTNNRMWRKNRNTAHFTTCGANDDLSNGIDLNRNFDFVWMSTGASNNPCAETYAGPTANSEPETRAIISYVNQLKGEGNFIYYFAFHSYSQMILVPYSHVSGYDKLQAANYADMYEVAIRGAEKLTQKYGTPYIVGTSGEILYEVSGSSFDWVKGVADIPIVYLFELRDLGQYGFLLPTEQIIPNNQEIMDALVEMDRTTRQLRYYEFSGSSSIVSSCVILVSSICALIYFR